MWSKASADVPGSFKARSSSIQSHRHYRTIHEIVSAAPGESDCPASPLRTGYLELDRLFLRDQRKGLLFQIGIGCFAGAVGAAYGEHLAQRGFKSDEIMGSTPPCATSSSRVLPGLSAT